MSLEKTKISRIKLEALISEIQSSQSKFADLKWILVSRINKERGENFDVEILNPSISSELASIDFLKLIFKLKGTYWLIEDH